MNRKKKKVFNPNDYTLEELFGMPTHELVELLLKRNGSMPADLEGLLSMVRTAYQLVENFNFALDKDIYRSAMKCGFEKEIKEKKPLTHEQFSIILAEREKMYKESGKGNEEIDSIIEKIVSIEELIEDTIELLPDILSKHTELTIMEKLCIRQVMVEMRNMLLIGFYPIFASKEDCR